jgi:polyhydroxyalkanoate synthase subunit PhaE
MTSTTKDWSDMATEMVNTWTETGTKMWKSWFDLVGSIPTPQPIAEMPQELKEATTRFLNNRDLFVRFLQLSVDAWKDIFPKIETGDNWQDILQKYTDQMQEQFASFSTNSNKITKNSTELWQLYLQEMQKYNQLWLDPMGLSMGILNKAVPGHSSALIEINNLYWDFLYEESFGSLMQSPILGPTREFTGKLLRGFDGWTNLYRASIDYQIVLADIQVRSFEALMRELITKAEKGEKVEDWRTFQQIWSQIADDVFEKAFCQEHNLKIRGNFLNALNKYRIQQQEIQEIYLASMNIPTRKEIDEVHQTIYELKKEVKKLKQELANQTTHQEVISE